MAKDKGTTKKGTKTKTVTTKIQYNIKTTKPEKIALQNILFGTDEKKLMVSDEFLHNMAVRYISKRMKSINESSAHISNSKAPSSFFKCCDDIEKCLDELIILEPYYIFKNPVPSIFKKNYLVNKPALTTAMLKRTWKHVLQRVPLEDPVPQQNIPVYDEIIGEMLRFSNRLSEQDLSIIDGFYKAVHGEEAVLPMGEDETAEEPEAEETEAESDVPDGDPEAAEDEFKETTEFEKL